MSQEKTEEPTDKKLREARKRGEVPRSRELVSAAVVLASAAALAATGKGLVDALAGAVRLSIRAAGGGLAASPIAVLDACVAMGLRAIAPLLAMVMVAGALVSFLQVGPLVAVEAVSPKLERIDPIRGAKNLFSQRQLVELLKSIVKITVIGWVAWSTLRDGVRGVVTLAAGDAQATLVASGQMVESLLLRVGGAMGALAVLDVLYQRWRYRQDQKMTKEEVKREHKESEGDPHAKQERERVHREIAEHGVVEQVRRADVLVVNPTHIAVALRYDEDEHEAPEVLVKGQDALAQRMIRAAQESGVPVMRDVSLARALFELQEGDEIPEALYEAVAAVLRAAWKERDAEDAQEGGA